ncbi:MAG: carboxy terminal-processing peptidase [Pseudomonadales bacterium]|nr:carboxy terminal-processing peptidase [Pseudomonadales bacterium]
MARLSIPTLALLITLGLWITGGHDSRADESAAAVALPAAVPTAPHAVAAEFEPVPTLTPLDIHPRTSLTIVEQLRHNHFLSKVLDDTLSSHIFDNYLNQLDSGKAYLLASDVAEFERHRYRLDDALVRGNLDPAFDMFNVFQQRQVERLQFLLGELGRGLDSFDFASDEMMDVERKQAPWPADTAELDRIWRQRLKAAALTMKLNGRPIDEVEELLTKRYKNRLKQALQTKSEDVFQLYVNAFAAVYDPHTQYFSPRTSQNFNINMSLSLEGIGAVLRSDDEYTSVVELVPAGPADKSGLLKPSDRIISVGQGDSGPLIDVVGWRLDDVVELIRGPKDSRVRLEIIPHLAEDAGARVITITRNTVQLEEQAAQKKLLTLEQNGVRQRIGIIEIPTFYADFKAIQQGDPNYKSTTRDVRRLIGELKAEGIDGLIVDLRNNGGGSLQEADSLTGLFIPSGPTVQVKSANRRPSIYTDSDNETAWDGPLAVLVNRLSASASEIFAGAIQDYERGLIIGSQTFGKGTVQTLIPLNRGQLKVTAAKFYRVSGKSTQHRGVIPDVAFPEVFDTDRIGESALEDAMPWDMIQPAVYTRGSGVTPLVSELNRRHSERVADDPDFAYLRALAARTRETAQQTLVSLNYAARQAEKADADRWRLELENQLRKAHGKAPVESLEDLEKVVEAEKDEYKDPANDALVKESAQILIDFVGLTRQIALAEHSPAR